ncbi:unnamed protein product [Prunus armeniaca]
MGRGHTKEFDEGDGNSCTHSVPPKEPLTGIFLPFLEIQAREKPPVRKLH